jgi:uncharacterized protein
MRKCMQYRIRIYSSQAKTQKQKRLAFSRLILYKLHAMAKKSQKLPAGKKKGASRDRWLIIGIIVSIVVIALVLWGPLRSFRPASEQKRKSSQQQTVKHEPVPEGKEAGRPAARKPAPARGKPETAKREPGPALLGGTAIKPQKTVQVAIVIDDLGADEKQARDLLALHSRITFAVMPGLAQSKKIAELARQNNRELLIHVPMEYRGKNGKPAPGMLRANMTPLEFLNTLSSDVESVPGAIGINNHEGSALTENKEAMKFLMAELKARNLMFLDSATTAKSVALATAKEFGLKSAKRDVFLDNDGDNPAAIRKQLDLLVETARKNGKAIGIGHPHPATLMVLRKWITETDAAGVELVPVSKLMN